MLTAFSRMSERFGRLHKDRSGFVTLFFALAAVVLILATGIAVDVGRIYTLRSRMQYALDSAALAAGSTMGTTAQMQARLNAYFAANAPGSYVATPVTASMTISNNVISATATGQMPTTFMRLGGITSVPVTVTSQINRAITGLELALVLDNTGSMVCGDSGYTTGSCTVGTPHYQSLQTDTQNIINTLFTNSVDTNNLKIAIVPYTTTVNPGPKVATAYMGPMTDVNGKPLYDAAGRTPTYDNQAPLTAGENTGQWRGCTIESKSMVASGYDTSEPSGGWAGRWVPFYWPSAGTPLSSALPASPASPGYSGIPDLNAWLTGIAGVASITNISYAHSGDLSTTCFLNTHGPNNGCPAQLTELTSDQSVLTAAVSKLVPWCGSGTMMHVGMVWGWRALSPNPPFADGKAYGTQGWLKAAVLETDGEDELVPDCDNPNAYMGCSGNALGSTFPTGPAINPQTQLTGEGRVPDGLLGTTTSINTAKSTMNTRLATVCTNMKAAGIVIYTIGFGPAAANGSDAATLQSCASDPSKYFAATNAAALQTAFQNIAVSLNNLRIAR